VAARPDSRREERCAPLQRDVASALEAWLVEFKGGPDDPVFPNLRGSFLSADTLRSLVSRHVAVASANCSSIVGRLITPHSLRHTTAMDLLRRGVDPTGIALWLGHESIETMQIYILADVRLKKRALVHADPSGDTPARFRPSDSLLAFLQSL
jgi:integrase/recombinase XerD